MKFVLNVSTCIFVGLASGGVATLLAQLGSGTNATRHDTLYSKPHDVYPEELMRQMPKPDLHAVPRTPGAAQASIYPNVNISVDTFPQNEPSVKISRKHPNRVVAAWRDFRTGENPAVRRVGYSLSVDGGTTWSTSALLPVIDSLHLHASDPSVGTDTAGNFYIATISTNSTNNDGKILVYRSTDEGQTFNAASIAPTIPGSAFDDKEYIACDFSRSSPFSNALYIAWTRFGTPGGIQLTRSTDGGHTWSSMVQVSDASGSVQGSEPAIGPNGEVYVVWAGSGIMFDKSTAGGASFGVDSTISPVGTLHGFPSIAVDLSGGSRNGYIYVTWSDHRNGDDDVFLSRSTDGGVGWSAPARVNNDPVGSLGHHKQQYWPWISVDDQGRVSVIFYDTRNTASNAIFEAYLARSTDGGATFTNQQLSSQDSPQLTPNSDVRFGDYIGIDSWDYRIVPVWTDERAGGYNMDIYTAVIKLPRPAVVPVSVASGWNILSVPVVPASKLKTAIFPTAVSPAFGYQGSYFIGDTLINGRAYWLKFGSNQTLHLSGDSLGFQTIPVYPEWNFIGSISGPVPVSAIAESPPGIITSRYFGYSAGYHAIDTVDPGDGSWVKASNYGQLVLSPAAAGQSPVAAQNLAKGNKLGSLSELTISDASGSRQTLYFGPEASGIDAARYEMPPVPPGGVFDARFVTQRMVALSGGNRSVDVPILVSGAEEPLSISWRIRGTLATLLLDGKAIALSGDGSLSGVEAAEKSAPRIRLIISEAQIAETPKEYGLDQNYPNPFNPTTEFRYQVPLESHVVLKIYDVLGQEVGKIVDRINSPGVYTVQLDGGNLGGGVYFARLSAEKFVQTRKILLIK